MLFVESPSIIASQALKGLKQQLQNQHNELQRQRQQSTEHEQPAISHKEPLSQAKVMSQSSSSLSKIGTGRQKNEVKRSAPTVGADRYEEIITTRRGRREGSQVTAFNCLSR